MCGVYSAGGTGGDGGGRGVRLSPSTIPSISSEEGWRTWGCGGGGGLGDGDGGGVNGQCQGQHCTFSVPERVTERPCFNVCVCLCLCVYKKECFR